ncbi:MAG: hypothetical protein O2923_04320 [Verrucomicrobia bacterium]|nr:hypothetical protein [Verrucomicrobiota bacterium]
MKHKIVALAVGFAFAGTLAHADVSSENTVGVFCIDLVAGKFNLVSAPMHKIPVDQGAATGNTGQTIADGGAGWTPGQFDAGVSNPALESGKSTYYVEMTSGALEGRHFQIASNDAATLFLEAAHLDLGAADVSLDGYKVVPYNRIRDVFGEPESTPLAGGTSAANADTILGFTAGSGFNTAIFLFDLFGTKQWQQGATEVNDLIVDRDAGLFVNMQTSGTDTNICLTGEVSDNDQRVVIDPGLSLQGGMNVVDAEVQASNLSNIVQRGTSAANADNILTWKSDLSGYDTAVFLFDLFGTVQWQKGALNVDADVFTAAGDGFFMLNRQGSSITWVRPTPLN